MIDRRQFTRCGLLAAAAMLGGRANTLAEPESEVTIKTREGALRGRAGEKLIVFKGVHYAESTAGRRFRPPVPVKAWTGVRSAIRLGDQCPQVNPDTAAWNDGSPQSEDCLVLNV